MIDELALQSACIWRRKKKKKDDVDRCAKCEFQIFRGSGVERFSPKRLCVRRRPSEGSPVTSLPHIKLCACRPSHTNVHEFEISVRSK